MREIRGTVKGFGSVEFEPARAEALVVQVESQVAAVLVATGTAVRRGDALMRLRPSAASRLEVDRAASEATVATAEEARQARLRDAGLATDSEAATAAAAAGTARRLRDSLVARTGGNRELVMTAPRDGVVDELVGRPGELLAAGSTVARIGDGRSLQARIGLEPADIRRLKVGAAATVSALDQGAKSVEGRITAIERRIDKDSGLAAALVSLPPTPELVPGMPVSGRIVASVRPGATVTPRAALLYERGETSVFVVAAGHAHRRAVHTGVDDEDGVEVLDGLKAGEEVATTGNHELEDGMGVRPPPLAASSAARASVAAGVSEKDPP